jgi:SAM-dependent methyltransferase
MQYSDSINQRLTGRHKKSFQFIGNITDKIILDIGCSYGWFEKWATENNCRKIIGIEPDVDNIKLLNEAIPNVIFKEGSALKVPVENEFFDIVVMWEVLEHLPKNTEKKALEEILRVLNPGGSFYLSTPNKTFWSCALDPAWWLAGHRHYNVNELNNSLIESGYEIVKIEYGGRFYELFSMILLYIFKWFFRKEIPFKIWFDKKRDAEFLNDKGFTNVFIKARKSYDQ